MKKNQDNSQFFICVDDVPHLDAQYAAFGKVCDEESLKVAVDISTVKTTSWAYYDDVPVDPVVIKKAYIIPFLFLIFKSPFVVIIVLLLISLFEAKVITTPLKTRQ